MPENREVVSMVTDDTGFLKRLQERFMVEAEADGRFSEQGAAYLLIRPDEHFEQEHRMLFEQAAEGEPLANFLGADLPGASKDFSFRCIFHRTRPEHVSGIRDHLPFKNATALRSAFESLNLPPSFFQISSGLLPAVHSHTYMASSDKPVRFELAVHSHSRQGDWSMALSSEAESNSTSVFWSVDRTVDSERLLDDMKTFKDCSVHPMFAPCGMLAEILRMAIQRRESIKERVRKLERAIVLARERLEKQQASDSSTHRQDESLEASFLFGLLYSCRQDQASREARYDFGESYYNAINEGFQYAERARLFAQNERLLNIHDDLKQWATLTWRQLKSLNARDVDHINTVDTLSHTLHNMVLQRDMRLQSNIAKATQRDSQDMKFIAVLGSVFAPASLVASILNVQEFQFAQGARLFGVYVGITLPLVFVVIFLCFVPQSLVRRRQRAP